MAHSEHSDIDHSNWSDHTDRPHTNWSNHSDAAHQDLSHLDWNNHVDQAHYDFTNSFHGDSPEKWSHDDHSQHLDAPHTDWLDHFDVAHENWTAHGDSPVGAHSDSPTGAHSDWSNWIWHNDWSDHGDWSDHSNWSDHGDVPHDDWSERFYQAHQDTIDHDDWQNLVSPHNDTSYTDHTDLSHLDHRDHDDEPHTDAGHVDWRDHSDTSHYNFSNHADVPHSDWNNVPWSDVPWNNVPWSDVPWSDVPPPEPVIEWTEVQYIDPATRKVKVAVTWSGGAYPVTVTVDWGDGSSPSSKTISDPNVTSAEFTHTYPEDRLYFIVIKVVDSLGREAFVTRTADFTKPTRKVKINIVGRGEVEVYGVGKFDKSTEISVPDGSIVSVRANSLYEADNLAHLLQGLDTDLDVVYSLTSSDHAELQVKVTRDGSITATFKKVYVKVTLVDYKAQVLGDPCSSTGVTVRVYAKAHYDVDVQAPYRLATFGTNPLKEIVCQLKVDFYHVMEPGKTYPIDTPVDVPYKAEVRRFTSPTTTSFDLEVLIEHHISGPIGPEYAEPTYKVGILANAIVRYDNFTVAVDAYINDQQDVVTVKVCAERKAYRVKINVKSVGTPPTKIEGGVIGITISESEVFEFTVDKPGIYEVGVFELARGQRYYVSAQARDSRGRIDQKTVEISVP